MRSALRRSSIAVAAETSARCSRVRSRFSHGRADTLIPCAQSGYLFDALAAAGNDATLVLFENLKHGFFNNPRLAEENYGEVTVRRSSPRGQDASWVFDPAADIPSMVCAFLRAQLVPIGASTPKSAKV